MHSNTDAPKTQGGQQTQQCVPPRLAPRYWNNCCKLVNRSTSQQYSAKKRAGSSICWGMQNKMPFLFTDAIDCQRRKVDSGGTSAEKSTQNPEHFVEYHSHAECRLHTDCLEFRIAWSIYSNMHLVSSTLFTDKSLDCHSTQSQILLNPHQHPPTIVWTWHYHCCLHIYLLLGVVQGRHTTSTWHAKFLYQELPNLNFATWTTQDLWMANSIPIFHFQCQEEEIPHLLGTHFWTVWQTPDSSQEFVIFWFLLVYVKLLIDA